MSRRVGRKRRIDVSTSELLFKKLFAEEVLEKENAYDCENCKRKSSTATRSLVITSLSNSLIFTANRFYYNQALNARVKKMNALKFCKAISIPDFAVEASEGKKNSLLYDLYAIIIHSVVAAQEA